MPLRDFVVEMKDRIGIRAIRTEKNEEATRYEVKQLTRGVIIDHLRVGISYDSLMGQSHKSKYNVAWGEISPNKP